MIIDESPIINIQQVFQFTNKRTSSHLFLDRQEHLDGNLCGNQRTLYTFLTQTMNKYEINFNRETNAIILERRFSPLQVKRLKSDCTFKIDTKFFGKNAGIYVNIVKMRLRQTKLTGNCIDSITIKHNDDAKKRFCGDLQPGEIKSIEDFKGKVKITVSIDRSVPFTDPEDYVEFQIVVTAYKGNKDTVKCKQQRLTLSLRIFQIVRISITSSTVKKM